MVDSLLNCQRQQISLGQCQLDFCRHLLTDLLLADEFGLLLAFFGLVAIERTLLVGSLGTGNSS